MKSILVIESDAMVRRFLRAAMQASNYSVVEAESDAQGLQAATRENIGVIVLDCMGTQAGGLRTLKKLRIDPRTHVIPVIAMSGLGQYGYDFTSLGQCVSCESVRAQPAHSENTRIAGPNCADSASRSTSGAGVSCCSLIFPAVHAPARSIAGATVV
jgi:CheY-like chemotaxis protein